MKIEELDDQELYELAQSVIGCRISLRSSGKVPEDDREDLAMQLQSLFDLNRVELIQTIQIHSDKYRKEKIKILF
ncbi:hypothetical protein OHW15_17000 [Acinetobacter baumannii]|uniref:hypothetical protein n=1 Tax=Acinetobacter baumannii TaxID=470 RepID=UPI00233ECADE|nr:hypothetical protein [Acinetobacter baumannii]MDC4524107.1 hypothetical protein [Acinetobacter baumannii]MDC4689216.1 hypothetical protein [Acinetobacter baumannii]MDC4987639.1 hypothetical protein [Acinetobacter baumannii]MDC5002012.1 hypothetical protein [Acinetobacter baumannii]